MTPRDQNNTIDAVDFAKSIIKYIEHNKINKYLARAQDLSIDSRITKSQYVGFHLYLQ
jgi:hypothetical protein